MADKEKIKNYLFNELHKLNLFEEIQTKIGYELMIVVNSYANSISKHIEESTTSTADKIAGAILLGCLLRDFILTEDKRELFEECFKLTGANADDEILNQSSQKIDERFRSKFYELFKTEDKKPQFMGYCEFVKRFEMVDCFSINEELGIINPIKCGNFKCMSLQCYCLFKDAYYGE